MLKNYRIWLAFLMVAAGLIVIAQGCGSSDTTSTTHTIYGSTS